MSQPTDLRIIGVKLVDASLHTHRVLNNLDTGMYPVMITLSRSVDPFEAKYLRDHLGIVVGDHDPMEALILETSIDALRAGIDAWQARLALASQQARQARKAALAEDKRRQEVADDLHRQVSPS